MGVSAEYWEPHINDYPRNSTPTNTKLKLTFNTELYFVAPYAYSAPSLMSVCIRRYWKRTIVMDEPISAARHLLYASDLCVLRRNGVEKKIM